MINRTIIDKVTHEVLVFQGFSCENFFLEFFIITVEFRIFEFLVSTESILNTILEKAIMLLIFNELCLAIVNEKAALTVEHVVFKVSCEFNITRTLVFNTGAYLPQRTLTMPDIFKVVTVIDIDPITVHYFCVHSLAMH